jgi:hypothetical protein
MANMVPPAHKAWTTGLFDVCAEPGGAGTCIYALLFPASAFGEMAAEAPVRALLPRQPPSLLT